MKSLRNKVALLTAASGGIGHAVARALATEGVDVAVSGRRADVLEALARDLRDRGVRAAVVPADLADLDRVDSVVDRTEEALGPVDLLINNAGVESCASFTRRTREDLTATVDLNLTAPMLLTHRVLPGMLERGAGHVVFMSSVAGKRGAAYQGPYCASKAGLVTLVQSLRTEYASTPVGFSVVCPGFVAGDGMFQRYLDEGLTPPRALGHTTLDRVAGKALAAIRRDLPEVQVNGIPVRPVLALAEIAPRLAERVVPWFGADRFFRRASADRGLLDSAAER